MLEARHGLLVVEPNIADQKGTGAEAVLTAAGPLNTLPFHVTWSDFTSGPPMLEAMGPARSTSAASANGVSIPASSIHAPAA